MERTSFGVIRAPRNFNRNNIEICTKVEEWAKKYASNYVSRVTKE